MKWLAALLILPCAALAQDSTECTTCGTYTTPNEIFYLTADLYCTGDGVTFSGADESEFHMQGYRIFFGSDAADGRWGLTIESCDSFVASNGAVYHNVSDNQQEHIYGIRLNNTNRSWLRDIDTDVFSDQITDGEVTKCIIAAGPQTWGNGVVGGTHTHHGGAWYDRQDWPIIAIGHYSNVVLDTLTAHGADFHLTVCSTTVYSPFAGIAFVETDTEHHGRWWVYDNDIWVKARDSAHNGINQVINCFGIAARWQNRLVAHGNTIHHSTDAGTWGNDGIFLERTQTETDGLYSLIYDNDVGVGVGGSASPDALRIRYACESVKIYNNIFRAYVDNNAGTDHTGDYAYCFNFGDEIGSTGQDSTWFFNNLCSLLVTGGWTNAAAVSVEGNRSDKYVNWYGNKLYSDAILVQWCYDNDSANAVTMIGDTLIKGDDPVSFQTFQLGRPGVATSAINNVVRDAVYQNGAAYDDITLGNQAVQDLRIERSLTITVEDAGTSPVQGAWAKAVDTYGLTQDSTLTDENGEAVLVVPIIWESRTETDSAFNTYTVSAGKAGYNNDSESGITVTPTYAGTTLTLPSGSPPASGTRIRGWKP